MVYSAISTHYVAELLGRMLSNGERDEIQKKINCHLSHYGMVRDRRTFEIRGPCSSKSYFESYLQTTKESSLAMLVASTTYLGWSLIHYVNL